VINGPRVGISGWGSGCLASVNEIIWKEEEGGVGWRVVTIEEHLIGAWVWGIMAIS